MESQEYGKCDICKKENTLSRKYYHYDIECECHLSGGKKEHFEIVRYCKDCKPKPPKEIRPYLLGENYIKESEESE